MKKNVIVKAGALILAIFLVLTACACKEAEREPKEWETDYLSREIKRADISYDEMDYSEYDGSTWDAVIVEMTELAKSTTQAGEATDGEKARFAELYDMTMNEYAKFVSAYVKAEVDSYLNVNDEEKADRLTWFDEMSVDLGDRFGISLGLALESPLRDLLIELHGDDTILDYEGYTESNEYLNSLHVQEDALMQTYDNLSVQEYDNYEQMNEALGNVIVQLVELRKKIAAENGYDDYVDYGFEAVYERDYTQEEYAQITEYIKEYMLGTEYQMEYLEYYRYDRTLSKSVDLEEVLKKLSEMEQLPQLSRDAFAYMYEHGLYIFTDSDDSVEMAFTTMMYAENEPIIYIHTSGTLRDIGTLLHEGGHYQHFFASKANAFTGGYASLDIEETHSNGFHFLFADELEELYPEAGKAIEVAAMSDALYTLVYESWLSDLEHALYQTGDTLTLEKANEIARETAKEYGLDYLLNDNYYMVWVTVNHIATSPIYQVSYVMSVLPALGIWMESCENEEAAEDKLMEIMLIDTFADYKEMLADYGLEYVLEEQFYSDLNDLITEKYLADFKMK